MIDWVRYDLENGGLEYGFSDIPAIRGKDTHISFSEQVFVIVSSTMRPFTSRKAAPILLSRLEMLRFRTKCMAMATITVKRTRPARIKPTMERGSNEVFSYDRLRMEMAANAGIVRSECLARTNWGVGDVGLTRGFGDSSGNFLLKRGKASIQGMLQWKGMWNPMRKSDFGAVVGAESPGLGMLERPTLCPDAKKL